MKHFNLLLILLLTCVGKALAGVPGDGTNSNYNAVNELYTSRSVSFSSTGAYEWEFNDEKDRMESTNKSNNNTTSTTTITISAGSKRTNLSFDYGVSSEKGYDKLTITLDGTVIVDGISGEKSSFWGKNLSASSHTLVVTYTKDQSMSKGDDCAFISNIVIGDVSVTENCPKDAGYPTKYYYSSDGTLVVSGTYATADFENNILDKRPGLKDQVERVIVEDNVPRIGKNIFWGMTSINRAYLGSGINYISDQAFCNCTNLANITIPDNIAEIGDNAFAECI